MSAILDKNLNKKSTLINTYKIDVSPRTIFSILSSIMNEVRNDKGNGVLKIFFHLGGISSAEYIEEKKLKSIDKISNIKDIIE